jgi:dihydroorotase
MKKYFISNVLVHWPGHSLHGKRTHVSYAEGKIHHIGLDIASDAFIKIPGDEMVLLPGLADVGAQFCDPGLEECETLQTGAMAAMAGGITTVMLSPFSDPPVTQKSSVKYLLEESKKVACEIFPLGCATKGMGGKDMAEIMDMWQAGAVGFTDDMRSVEDSYLFQRILAYTKSLRAPIMHYPQDPALSRGGKVHESAFTQKMGLKGIPRISEIIAVTRDIELCKHIEAELHITGISTLESVELIRTAKKRGIGVTCDVSILNLFFTDKNLGQFRSDLKVLPPLRENKDMEALWEGIRDGTIDFITSRHHPRNSERKRSEFERSDFGASTIQGFLPALWEGFSKHGILDLLPEKTAFAPRRTFLRSEPKLEKDAPAHFVVLKPNQENRHLWFSRGKSTPEEYRRMQHEVILTCGPKGSIRPGTILDPDDDDLFP